MAATNNRFLKGYSSIDLLAASQTGSRQGEFYQQIAQALIKGFHTKEAIVEFGQRLTALAQHFYTFRQMDNVEQASQILINLPIAEYRNIGLYYYALAIKRHGQAAQAEALLERVADDAPIRYRGQALLSLGAFTIARGDLKSALRYYKEALKVASKKDLLIIVQTLKMVAVVKGMDGDHRGAVADLEKLQPAARLVSVCHPQSLSDYYNSVAVELCEVGRLEEAQNVSRIVLASPYASAYPEYRETSDEIAFRGYRHSRSVVSLNHSALNISNVLHLPLPEHSDITSSEKHSRSPFQQQASITVLKTWKEEKMVKEPDDNDAPNDDSEKDLLFGLMELVAKEDFSIEELHKLIKSAKKIASERQSGKGTD